MPLGDSSKVNGHFFLNFALKVEIYIFLFLCDLMNKRLENIYVKYLFKLERKTNMLKPFAWFCTGDDWTWSGALVCWLWTVGAGSGGGSGADCNCGGGGANIGGGIGRVSWVTCDEVADKFWFLDK